MGFGFGFFFLYVRETVWEMREVWKGKVMGLLEVGTEVNSCSHQDRLVLFQPDVKGWLSTCIVDSLSMISQGLSQGTQFIKKKAFSLNLLSVINMNV